MQILKENKINKSYKIIDEQPLFWEEGKQLYFSEFESFFKNNEGKKNKTKLNNTDLNELNGSEWSIHSKSVQTFNGPITEKRKKHGASFPLTLAKHFIKIYSKPGDTVLDPFAGVGTTLDAANILKRHSLGIELNYDFINLFNQGIDPKDGKNNNNFRRIMIQDSALKLTNHIPQNSIHFILTSPPYANLLNKIRKNFADKDYYNNPYKNQSRKLAQPYSKEQEDLGNVSYEDYLLKIKKIFLELHKVAKDGTYNVWVVRDFRDTDNNIPYVNLHGDLINIAQQTNWVMWDFVIWDQSNQRKLVRLGGNKSRRYYFNIGHSFVIIFRKNIKGENF